MADSSAFDSGSRPHKLAVAVSWPYSLGQKAPGWKRKKKKNGSQDSQTPRVVQKKKKEDSDSDIRGRAVDITPSVS